MICCCLKQDILETFAKIQQVIDQQNVLFKEAIATMCYNVFICDIEIIDQAIQLLYQIATQNTIKNDNSLENNYVFWYINRSITKILTINKYTFNQSQLDTIYQIIQIGTISNELKVRKSVGEALGCYYSYNINTYSQMLQDIQNQINIFSKHDKNQKYELDFNTQTILLSFTSAIQILTGTHNWIKINSTQVQKDHQKLLNELYNLLPLEFTVKALNGSYQQALIKALIPNQQQIKQLLETQYLMSLEGALDAQVYMQRYWNQQSDLLTYNLLLCQSYPVQVISQLAMRINHYYNYKQNDRCDLLSFDWQNVQVQQLIQFIQQQMKSQNKDIIIAAFNLLNNYVKDNYNSIEVVDDLLFEDIQRYIQDYKEVQNLVSTLMEYNKLSKQQQSSIQTDIEEIFLYLDDNSACLIPYIIYQKNIKLIQYIILGAFDISGNVFSQISRQWLNISSQYFDSNEMMQIFQELQETNPFMFNGVSSMIYYMKQQLQYEIDEQIMEFKDYMQENLDALEFDQQIQDYFNQYIQYDQNNIKNTEIVQQVLSNILTEQQIESINNYSKVDINEIRCILKTSMELQPLEQIVLYGSLIQCKEKLVLSEKMDIKYNSFVDFNETL